MQFSRIRFRNSQRAGMPAAQLTAIHRCDVRHAMSGIGKVDMASLPPRTQAESIHLDTQAGNGGLNRQLQKRERRDGRSEITDAPLGR